MIRRSIFAVALITGCGGPPAGGAPQTKPLEPAPSATTTPPVMSATASATTAIAPPAAPTAAVHTFPLPGITAPASLDFIAYEPSRSRIWVPVGNDGSVDVFDTAAQTFAHVAGFATVEREKNGKKRTQGPSAASVGDGVVYVGNRASNEICPVDEATLKVGKCLKLKSVIDCVTYVSSTKEVWVTTPDDHSLTVLDASSPANLKVKATIKTDGSPEGYAVDTTHGWFLTNLEDKNKTLAIDIKTRKVLSTWDPACGADGPRGVAVDPTHPLVFVACTDHIQVLDAAHAGAPLAKLDAGAGIDNIEWSADSRLLFVGAGKAGKLFVIHADEAGQLTTTISIATTEGARNAVVDAKGNIYLADGPHAQLVVVSQPTP